MSRNPLPQGKRIHVYRSGDANYEGARINYNPMIFRRMENFLDEISEKVPTWGAVRSIHTPNTGTVVKDFDILQKDGRYVAAGPKGFVSIPGGYLAIGKPRTKIDLSQHSVIRKLGSIAEDTKHIWIFRNGEASAQARPFTISSTDRNWDKVLERMTETVGLSSGAVKRLYSLNGKILDTFESLEDSGYYVAAGSGETLRRLSYGDKKALDTAVSEVDDTGNSNKRVSRIFSKSKDKIVQLSRLKKFSKKSKEKLSKKSAEGSTDEEVESRDKEPQKRNRKPRSRASTKKKNAGTTKPNRRKSVDESSTRDALSRMSLREQSPLGSLRSRSAQSGESASRNRNWGSQEDDIDHIYESLSQYEREGTPTHEDEPSADEGTNKDHFDLNLPDRYLDSGRGSLLSDRSSSDGIFRAKKKFRPSARTIAVDYDTDEGGIFRAKSRSEYTRNAGTVLEDSKTKIEIPVDLRETREVSEEVY